MRKKRSTFRRHTSRGMRGDVKAVAGSSYRLAYSFQKNHAYHAKRPLEPDTLQARLQFGDLKGKQTSGGVRNAVWNKPQPQGHKEIVVNG